MFTQENARLDRAFDCHRWLMLKGRWRARGRTPAKFTSTRAAVPDTNSRLENFHAWSNFLQSWATAMGALLAGAIALHQYLDNSKAEQVKHTLYYLNRFHEEALAKARARLEEVWNPRSDEIFRIQNEKGETVYGAWVRAVAEKSSVDREVRTIIDFYDELHACSVSGLCEVHTAVRFFGKYASDFRGLLYPVIIEHKARMKDPQIGTGVDYFAKRYDDSLASN